MRDESDDLEAEAEMPSLYSRIKGTMSTGIGAAIALALLIGAGLWFYGLGTRDIADVPIIRAAVEPAKVRPDDPGGLVTPHQSVASYEAASIQPASVSSAVLAPPAPEPRVEDVPMVRLGLEQQVPVMRPLSEDGEGRASVSGVVSDAQTGVADQERIAAIDPEILTDQGTSVEEISPAPKPAPGGTVNAPRRSPAAPRKPTDLKARMKTASKKAEKKAETLVTRAATSKVQIQLAADPDEIAMRVQWDKVLKANRDVLRDKALAIQTTRSGGTVFYRLRVGPFRDAAEAKGVCQALKARGQDCIVARNG